jgi:hypothetical protein
MPPSTASEVSFEPPARCPWTFSFVLQLQDVDAAAFLSTNTPMANLVTGRITLSMEVIGSLDHLLLPDRPSLVGSGQVFLQEGGIASTPLTGALATFLGVESLRSPTLRNWATSFVMEAGGFRLADAVVEGAPGDPNVAGNIGFDGSLDLLSIFHLPTERLEARVLERIGVDAAALEGITARGGVVQAILSIGGFISNPQLRAEPSVPAGTLAETVQEEVQAEAQQRIEEQKQELQERAAGLLRGLLQRRDTVGIPPPDTTLSDTIRPDTIPPDTVQADTIPPDTVSPDTVRPDTIPPDTLLQDTVQPNTIPPDTMPPDTVRPDTIPPDTMRFGVNPALRPVPEHSRGSSGLR